MGVAAVVPVECKVIPGDDRCAQAVRRRGRGVGRDDAPADIQNDPPLSGGVFTGYQQVQVTIGVGVRPRDASASQTLQAQSGILAQHAHRIVLQHIGVAVGAAGLPTGGQIQVTVVVVVAPGQVSYEARGAESGILPENAGRVCVKLERGLPLVAPPGQHQVQVPIVVVVAPGQIAVRNSVEPSVPLVQNQAAVLLVNVDGSLPAASGSKA